MSAPSASIGQVRSDPGLFTDLVDAQLLQLDAAIAQREAKLPVIETALAMLQHCESNDPPEEPKVHRPQGAYYEQHFLDALGFGVAGFQQRGRRP